MGNVYVYTGTGVGKTTSALGLALRAVGQGKKVIIIQFMKGRKDIGEWKIKRRLGKNYEIHQFGHKGWVNIKKPTEKDKKLAKKGLDFARKSLKRKPDLLILDEIILAIKIDLIREGDVLGVLKKVPRKTDVVLTGRFASKALIGRADFVNEMKLVKMPKKVRAKRGIHY
ncbi:MAG: cob(I)yrinic acid a,c-diamide adenosyltransferase [Candidatus Aenigmatarchaeota archaeon]